MVKRSKKTGLLYWVMYDEKGNKIANSFSSKSEDTTIKTIDAFEQLGYIIKWDTE